VAGSEGDCERSASIFLSTYGLQGEFSWAPSAPTALPAAHKGLERWGYNSPDLQNRSVFIDWHDYQGNYGFEQINYWQVLLVIPRAPTIAILNHKGRNGV
jgi:hypothetical protein